MATALVVADLNLAADVGGDGTTEVTLDLVLAFDVVAQRDEVLLHLERDRALGGVEPAHVALWAVPTAVAALVVHGARLLLLDRRLARGRAVPGAAQQDGDRGA